MDLGKCISTHGAVPEILAMSKLQSEGDLTLINRQTRSQMLLLQTLPLGSGSGLDEGQDFSLDGSGVWAGMWGTLGVGQG